MDPIFHLFCKSIGCCKMQKRNCNKIQCFDTKELAKKLEWVVFQWIPIFGHERIGCKKRNWKKGITKKEWVVCLAKEGLTIKFTMIRRLSDRLSDICDAFGRTTSAKLLRRNAMQESERAGFHHQPRRRSKQENKGAGVSPLTPKAHKARKERKRGFTTNPRGP